MLKMVPTILVFLVIVNVCAGRPFPYNEAQVPDPVLQIAGPALAPEVFVPTSSRHWPNKAAHVNWPLVGGLLGGGFLLFALLVVALCYCSGETPGRGAGETPGGGGPEPTSATAERGGELVVLDQAGQPQRLVWRAFG